jgi:hypothetical protein
MTYRPLDPLCGSVRRRRTVILAGMTFVGLAGLVGCDNPEIQTALWTGANDLVVSLVDALFLAFKPGSDQITPVTTSWLLDAVSTAMA